MKRELFICVTDETGVRTVEEVWDDSPEFVALMAQLGWVRSAVVQGNGHAEPKSFPESEEPTP